MRRPERKHSEWKEPYELLNGAKPLSNNNSCAEEGKRKALKWTSQIRKEPYKNHSKKNRTLQNAKNDNKSTKKKSTDRRMPLLKALKSSTRRTQTSGIFVKQVVFHTVNHCGPLPLKELHSTGATIVWRDPGGSWACLLPVYVCVWNHQATGCDMWTTPEKHTKKRETLRNTNQKKTTRRAGNKVYDPCPPPPPPPPQAFQIKGALWNAEQNKNTNNKI